MREKIFSITKKDWRRAVIKDTEYSTIGRLIIGQYVDTTIHQKLEEEKVRWAKHGIELAEDVRQRRAL